MSFKLDHVAIAARDVTEVLTTLVGELGAPVIFGGNNMGFRAMQVEAGNLRIELLEPHNVEVNDFLERFLQRNGDGPHHLTFKTDDIVAEIARAEEAGYTMTGVNIANDFWKEAFIHPKQGGGTVIQIAQAAFDPLEMPTQTFNEHMGTMRWWPEPPPLAEPRAWLQHVVIVSDEMTKALDLYRTYLGAEVIDRDEGWLELAWEGGGRIRLEHAAGRKAGVDRLEWTHDGPPHEFIVAGTLMSVYSAS